MTLKDCIDNRRWAESMMGEINASLKAKWSAVKADEYWYIKNWLDSFDRLIANFTCWPEYHVNYKRGLEKLKQLSKTL